MVKHGDVRVMINLKNCKLEVWELDWKNVSIDGKLVKAFIVDNGKDTYVQLSHYKLVDREDLGEL